MGFFARASIVAFCLGLAALIQNYRLLSQPLSAPEIDTNEYWGPGRAADYKENTAVIPFDIATKPEVSSTTYICIYKLTCIILQYWRYIQTYSYTKRHEAHNTLEYLKMYAFVVICSGMLQLIELSKTRYFLTLQSNWKCVFFLHYLFEVDRWSENTTAATIEFARSLRWCCLRVRLQFNIFAHCCRVLAQWLFKEMVGTWKRFEEISPFPDANSGVSVFFHVLHVVSFQYLGQRGVLKAV